MSEIFFSPKISGTPITLTVVKVDQGLITYEDWIKALSNRINGFLSIESNPKKAARKACEKLLLPICDDLHNFGDHLTVNNPRFREYFSLDSFDDEAFPYFANNQASDNEMYYKSSLEVWVDMLDFVLSGAIESGLSLISPYSEREISTPDETIKPYVDFINTYLGYKCDFELTDPNECDVYSIDYDFHFFLRSTGDEIIFSKVILEKRNIKIQSLDDLEKSIQNFNNKFSAKISYKYKIEKKWLFSKKKFILEVYFFEFRCIATKNEELIAESLENFHNDLMEFYKLDLFYDLAPKANFEEEADENFFTHLKDELLIWKFFKERPELKEKYLNRLNP